MILQIVSRAFASVFGNFGAAIKSSLVPFLVGGVVVVGTSVILQLPINEALINKTSLFNTPKVAFFVVIVFAINTLALAWGAVTWHRFLLLGERPSIVPKLRGISIGGYLLRVLMLGLQAVAFIIVFKEVISLFISFLLGTSIGAEKIDSPIEILNSVMVVLAFAILPFYLMTRVGISLAAAAIGKSMGTMDAWTETDIARGPIFFVSLILLALNVIPVVGLAYFLAPYPFALSIGAPLLSWLNLLIMYSFFAVLYDHCVNGSGIRNRN